MVVISLLTLTRNNWLPITVIILFTITALSLWPLENLPSVPGSDKTHHLIAYAALMFPAALQKPENWLLIALSFIAYGGAIELLQPSVNRYGEWLDFAANTIGVICGIALGNLMSKFQ
ncbi:MAG: VanZ family protein [Gammaproteobacteria bacterium]|nr:VanZ family protein [Gammaproteobacteria bacterium]MBT4608374.1 VanZ family protein [Thiotrichales bacterium]MBT7023686.1 VanZ family protein [Gammaproteobacteria bacterium]